MDTISDFIGGIRYFAYWNSKARYGSQIPVKNREEVVRLIQQYNGTENCGISISTFIDNVPFLLFIPFDFDSPNLHDSWLDAIKLFNFISISGYKSALIFSGSKGFHVIVKTVPLIYTKKQLRDLQFFLRDYLKLKTFDSQIAGDIRRIMRIPGTYHINGHLCRVIAESDGIPVNLNDFTTNIKKKVFDPDYPTNGKIYHEYPCVEKYIKWKDYWIENHPRHSYEPSWLLRFAYVIELIDKGLSDSEITDILEGFGWDDFDRYKTEYFVNHIRGKGYTHPSCETLKSFGFCLDGCPYSIEFKPKKVKYERSSL